jgi:oligosaccharide 4-alpha-D-glucosyltransferase
MKSKIQLNNLSTKPIWPKSFLYRIFWLTTLILSFQYATFAQRSFIDFKKLKNSIEIKVTDGVYLIEPFNNQIVHTTFLPKKTRNGNFSFARAMEPENVAFTINDNDQKINISTSGISVEITKKPFKISYQYKNELLLQETKGYFIDDTLKAIGLQIDKDEVLYGGGERVLGMNRRGYKLQLYNRAHYGYGTHSELMNYTLPLFLSSKKYAVLFDNAASGYLDLDSKKDNSVTYSAVSGTMNYYVIAGNSWLNLIEEYTRLTGRQPLPPLWAFGNFSSRFGYHSQRQVMQTIDKFIRDSIPVDAVIIDIYWFGQGIFGSMGNLDWYKDSFPNPKAMIDTLKAKGIKTILVTEPFILTTSDRWKDAVDKKVICLGPDNKPFTYNFYFGNTGLIDIYKPEARQWFWDIYKDLTLQGIDGWWGDLGEPEVHPAVIKHENGNANDIHNAYGHSWAQMIYEGYQKDFPAVRPFILMRSGYAGSQRYGMIPWTGDVNRNWDGLESQPELALTMGMQGIAYTHSDLGGFADGTQIDDELYTRWLQYGVFQPVFRPHAQEQIPSEPVFMKNLTKKRAKKSIELRYRLLPYNYSLAFENHHSGKPLMMPLFFVEPDNKELLTYDKCYLWGDNILVCPVKQFQQRNAVVYLPKNSDWIDFYTGLNYKGGQRIDVQLSPENIPVFVKNGSIIPMSNANGNTTNYSSENIEIHYWPNKNIESKFEIYTDDGLTQNAYEKQEFEILSIKGISNNVNLKVSIDKNTGANYKNSANRISVVIHNINNKPKQIKAIQNNSLIISSDWDRIEKKLTIKLEGLIQSNQVDIQL